jgi:small subunit ribosomal protein S20
LANSAQARKRARQSTVNRLQNVAQRSQMRTHIKQFLKAVQAQDRATAEAAYRRATSFIDRAARKGLQHKNKAARLKSRLNARLRVLPAAT